MRRILLAASLLLILVTALGGLLIILVTALGGCQDRRKDDIPTQIKELPKGQPQPVPNHSPD